MKVSIDGGQTFQDVGSVYVCYDDVDVPGEDDLGQVQVKLTDEGIVSDVWVTREENLDHNIGTESETIQELIDRLVEEGA